MATSKSNSGKKRWTLLAAGTAVILLTAGVLLQVTRPPSAFPEETNAAAGRSAQPQGKSSSSDAAQMATMRVARVGNQFITWQELANECISRHGKDILDNLINRKIIQQACDNEGIEVSEAEVSKQVEKEAKSLGLAVDQFISWLESERNITVVQFRRDIVWPKLALKKLAGGDVKVTRADINKAFARNYGPRVEARAIVVDNSRRAREVWDKAHANPDDFEKLAQECSMDPSSRAMGGKIPPIAQYSGSEEVEKAAFKLKKGEISPVIQIGPNLNQYIIIKCEGRTVPTVTEMTSDIEQILTDQIREEKTQLAVMEVFEKIKSEARVDNYVTNVSTGGDRKAAGKSAGAPGAIRQMGATAPRKSTAPADDDEQPAASARPAATTKASARSTGKSAQRPAADR